MRRPSHRQAQKLQQQLVLLLHPPVPLLSRLVDLVHLYLFQIRHVHQASGRTGIAHTFVRGRAHSSLGHRALSQWLAAGWDLGIGVGVFIRSGIPEFGLLLVTLFSLALFPTVGLFGRGIGDLHLLPAQPPLLAQRSLHLEVSACFSLLLSHEILKRLRLLQLLFVAPVVHHTRLAHRVLGPICEGFLLMLFLFNCMDSLLERIYNPLFVFGLRRHLDRKSVV